MNVLEIFVHDASDEYEYDFGVQKGYWDNIYVKKKCKVFRINVITLERLIQDCKTNLDWFGCYLTDPNIVVVDKALKSNIIKTLLKQDEMQFFEHIAHCDINGEILYLKSEELWNKKGNKSFNINELEKIYP